MYGEAPLKIYGDISTTSTDVAVKFSTVVYLSPVDVEELYASGY